MILLRVLGDYSHAIVVPARAGLEERGVGLAILLYFNATAGAALELTTTIFVPQGGSSSGSVVLPLANVAPAQGSIFPLVVSQCCACRAVPLFSDGGLERQRLLAFVEEEIQVGILQAAVIVLEPRRGLVGRDIRRGQGRQNLRE